MDINSQEYWDLRFRTNWEDAGGHDQGMLWADIMQTLLPEWLINEIKEQSYQICDWGCGQGEMAAMLRDKLGLNHICGCDFSSAAIERARELYPKCRFVIEDWLQQEKLPSYDVVFSSNTLEHFHDSQHVLRHILGNVAQKYIVLLLPYLEPADSSCKEHFSNYSVDNLLLNWPGWQCICVQNFDNRKTANSHLWNGQQILLVYASTRHLTEQQSSFFLNSIVNFDHSQQIEELSRSLSERKTQVEELNRSLQDRELRIDELNHSLQNHELKIDELNRSLKDRELKIDELNHSLQDHELKIDELNHSLQDHELKIDELNHSLQEIDKMSQREMLNLQHKHHEEKELSLQNKNSTLTLLRNQADMLFLNILELDKSRFIKTVKWLKTFKHNVHNPMYNFKMITNKLRGRGDRINFLNPCEDLKKSAELLCKRIDDSLGVNNLEETVPATTPTHGQTAQAFKLLNINNARPVVSIVAFLFYDRKGKQYMFGGAERYLVELARIIKGLGLDVEIIQSGDSDWTLEHPTDFGYIPVIAMKCGCDCFTIADEYNRRYAQNNLLTIYSPFLLASHYCRPNSIGISHGVFWDHPSYTTNREKWTRLLENSMLNCTRMVSVDTNTINWSRTVFKERFFEMDYIPNFVDINVFHPNKHRNVEKKITVLYPRRLYSARGFEMTLELTCHLMRNYQHVHMHFVGDADEADAKKVQKLVNKYPERVRWETVDPDKMPDIYRQADISLIPTCYSEGTSLSCLEAMATGNVVIASNVGGLPELVRNRFNGLLIKPCAEELIKSVDLLICDPELRRRLSDNAVKTAQSYDITVWRKSWRTILCEMAEKSLKQQKFPSYMIQMATDGMTWSQMFQRPQQLLKAVSVLDMECCFASDETLKPFFYNTKLRVVGNSEPIPLDNAAVYTYYAYNLIRKSNFNLLSNSISANSVLFDILDDPNIHNDSEYLKEFDFMLNNSTYVITSSRVLFDKFKTRRCDIKLIPNAATPEDFRVPDMDVAITATSDLPVINGKLIGYYGAIAEWTDFELLEKMAKKFKTDTIVLIGIQSSGVLDRIARISAQYSNLHFIPPRPYEKLKYYLARFDVAFIPFICSDVTHGVSPVKFFEYCSGGKPVVSSNFAEMRQYACQGVWVSNNNDKFVEDVDLALALTSAKDQNWRKNLEHIAMNNTWHSRAVDILALFSSPKFTKDTDN